MKADLFLARILDPGLAFLEATLRPGDGAGIVTPQLRILLLAIAGQESGWTDRLQNDDEDGPAKGWWQFERGGGVRGVLNHPHTALRADRVLVALEIPSGEDLVHQAIAWNDNLAVAFARLLLWADPQPLPEIGERDAAWGCYLTNWKPGLPGPDRWPANYEAALAAGGHP